MRLQDIFKAQADLIVAHYINNQISFSEAGVRMQGEAEEWRIKAIESGEDISDAALETMFRRYERLCQQALARDDLDADAFCEHVDGYAESLFTDKEQINRLLAPIHADLAIAVLEF